LQSQVNQLLSIKPEVNFKERDSGTDKGSYTRTMSQIGG
ncbi:MAG: cyclic pyranopterin phosphate synthase MoaA, partial [Waterburya sp.]